MTTTVTGYSTVDIAEVMHTSANDSYNNITIL